MNKTCFNRLQSLTVLAACAWGFSAPDAAYAQVMVSPAITQRDADVPNQDRNSIDESSVQTLTIWASAEPQPAMRYRFWPAPHNRLAKNVMPMIGRSVVFQASLKRNEQVKTHFTKAEQDWPELSLKELPTAEVHEFLNRYSRNVLAELERGENCMLTAYDLDIDRQSAAAIVNTLLPEFQEMRGVARILNLRLRLAAAEGRWDDFSRDCRLSFRLAEAASRSTDFLVGRLVGIAIAGLAMQSIEEAMQEPNCPNFYWALASIPEERLFETREAIEFDGTLVSRLNGNEPLPDEPIGPEAARMRLKQLTTSANDLLTASGTTSEKGSLQLMAGLYVVTMVDTAREALQKTDQWRDRVQALSAPEAVLRYTHLRFNQLQDDWMKWSLLPPEQAAKFIDRQENSMKRSSASGNVLESLVAHLSPAVKAASRAGLRARQEKFFLMTVEAIRIHAAQSGVLPNQLSDLDSVPAMTDPLTLVPFEYLRTSDVGATLKRAARYPSDKQTTFQINLMKKDRNQ
ncbi:hypothetical protein [Planctomycetes bacterium K23_9]|uniref:Uncharacterized protein n=1 Tax=Stieleria marina TaxID=1930275 RepID=A0A517NXP0_9BACT|nr:hypothetical protein K239x_38720 [Planctomycetes bacterium K23_9]